MYKCHLNYVQTFIQWSMKYLYKKNLNRTENLVETFEEFELSKCSKKDLKYIT